MEETICKALSEYCVSACVQSFIFCRHLNSKLKESDITQHADFLCVLSDIVAINKEQGIFSENEKYNCFELISRCRNREGATEHEKKLCSKLIGQLNSSHSNNAKYYLYGLCLMNSFKRKKVLLDICDDDEMIGEDFETFFDACYKTGLMLLLGEEEKARDDLVFQLAGNENYFMALVDITNNIPELLSDPESVSRLYSVLEINNKITIAGEKIKHVDKYMYKQNELAKRYLKKRSNHN